MHLHKGPSIVSIIKSSSFKWIRHVEKMDADENTTRVSEKLLLKYIAIIKVSGSIVLYMGLPYV